MSTQLLLFMLYWNVLYAIRENIDYKSTLARNNSLINVDININNVYHFLNTIYFYLQYLQIQYCIYSRDGQVREITYLSKYQYFWTRLKYPYQYQGAKYYFQVFSSTRNFNSNASLCDYATVPFVIHLLKKNVFWMNRCRSSGDNFSYQTTYLKIGKLWT